MDQLVLLFKICYMLLCEAGSENCLKLLTKVLNEVLFEDKLPGDTMRKSSYRGIKLLKHAFELYERVLDKTLRKIVGIDKIQYGFML